MRVQSIDIAVRSRRERPPRVRFERAATIPAGTISLVVFDGDLVVSCGTSAVVDAVGSTLPDGNPGTVPELLLRDGEFELAVCCRSFDEPRLAAANEGPPSRNDAERFGALTVRDAEWTAVDDLEAPPTLADALPPVPPSQPRVVSFAAPPARRDARDPSWDQPTRFQPVVQPLPERPFPAPTPGETTDKRRSPPAGAPTRRRMLIRRIALLSMLLCAFMLTIRARRAREARAVAPAASGVAAAASTATGVSSRPQRQSGVSVPAPPATSTDAPVALDAAPITPGPHKGAPTKARRAADALANGSYAEALRLYEELRADQARAADATVAAGQPSSGAAYEQASRIIRARLEQNSVSTQ